LLPAPRRDGRIGRYDSAHRARLGIIGRLQERGYSLAAIRMAAAIREGAADIARAATGEFVEHLWPAPTHQDLEATMKRARLLLAQASASFVVHELGQALSREAQIDESGLLDAVIGRIAIGQIRRLQSGSSDGQNTTKR
jgi:DNA-binding transcriptional MerR regulator